MYFFIPGIVSQTLGEVFQLNLPPAVELVLIEKVDAEVLGLLPLTFLLTLTETASEVYSAQDAISTGFFSIPESQVYHTPKAFAELLQIERGKAEVHSTQKACLLQTIETGIRRVSSGKLPTRKPTSRVKTTKPTTDLSGYETGGIEVHSVITSYLIPFGYELSDNSVVNQLVTTHNAIDLSGVTGSQFLPGSPGYVAGEATPAVELVGVEVGYPPQPLPIGFYGVASDIIGVKGANSEVRSILGMSDVGMIDTATSEPKTTLTAESVHILEVASEVDGRVLEARIISIIEPSTKKAVAVSTFAEIGLIELAQAELGSTLSAVEYSRIEKGDRYLQETVFPAIEEGIRESPGKELHLLPSAICLLPSPYAAESAITKP